MRPFFAGLGPQWPRMDDSPLFRPDVLAKSFAAYRLIERSFGYKLPPPREERMHTASSAAAHLERSGGIARPTWSEERWRRWRGEFCDALMHVRHGLNAAHYHHGRLALIESELISIIRQNTEVFTHKMPEGFGQMTTGLSCQPLSFEYQAFLFAERRTLEYLAVAVAKFFVCECHRIRRLDKAIRGAEPQDRGDRVIVRLDRELAAFGLARDERRSARDRVAHWEAVEAGVWNVTAFNEDRIVIFLAADEAELPGMKTRYPLDQAQQPTLREALDARLERLTNFILGMYEDLGLLPPGPGSEA
jgi:hypothetical protein